MSGATGQPRVGVVFPASGRCDHVDLTANLAVLLACSGRRVLVLDFAGDDRSVQEYLAPFPRTSVRAPLELQSAVTALVAEPLVAVATMLRFDLADDQSGAVATIEVGEPAGLPRLAPARAGAQAVTELRTALLGSGFDDVLVALPEPEPDTAAAEALAAKLADTVLVAFGPSESAVTAAAGVVRRIREATPVLVDVLPVLTRVPTAEPPPPLIARVRAEATAQFALLFAEQADRGADQRCVELPQVAYSESAAILAVVAEPPDGPLWREYERMATWLTRRERWTQPPRHVRSGYRYAVGLDATPAVRPVVIGDLTGAGAWADWARTQVVRAGGTVVAPADAPPGTPALLLSRGVDDDDTEVPADLAAPRLHQVPITVPEPYNGGAGSADAFRTRLLAACGFVAPPRAGDQPPTRFPWSRPAVRNLPVGRDLPGRTDPDLARLRELLLVPSGARTVVLLHGPTGAGKSALAQAYAEHFAWDYQGVWWVSAGTRRSVLRSVAALGAELLPADRMGGRYGETRVLNAVARPQNRRHLLVYDACDDLAALTPDLLPPVEGDVHVLVTTRAGGTADWADHRIGLSDLRPEQAVARLTERVPDLTPAAAAAVGEALRHEPSAVWLAGAWLRERCARLRAAGDDALTAANAARTELVTALADRAEPTRTAAMLAVTVDTLLSPAVDRAGTGHAAVLVTRCLDRLSPEGVDLEFVQSRELTRALAAHLGPLGDALALDSAEIDRALALAERHGLLTVDWGAAGVVRAHRAECAAVAALADPVEAARIAALVLDALAEFAPAESAPDALRRRFRELAWHVESSGALESTRPQVRRWLVNQVRYHYEQDIRAVSEETLLHGDRLLAAWERAGVPESDPLRLRLMGQLANLARALGERDRAKKLDTEALDVQSAVHPVLPPAALALCAGLGGDDRGLGNYHDALATDQQTWVGLVRELGEDHPRTRMAANNLAASLYLLGDVQGALEAERHNHDRLTRLFGPGHERTDWSEVRLAVYERDLGLGDPVERLRELFQRLSGKPGRERLSRIACWQWSMALRDRGSLGPALTRANEALQGLRTMLPPTHPDIIAAMLTNASIVRRADGRAREALATAERACAELDPRDIGPEHPFRALAGLGLGLAIAAAGDHDAGTAAVAAAGAALHARFDRVHPWTLAAELDLAVLTAASGDRDTAVELTEAALDDLLDADAVGPTHPYVQVAEHNLRLAAAGELGNWREIDVDIPHT